MPQLDLFILFTQSQLFIVFTLCFFFFFSIQLTLFYYYYIIVTDFLDYKINSFEIFKQELVSKANCVSLIKLFNTILLCRNFYNYSFFSFKVDFRSIQL